MSTQIAVRLDDQMLAALDKAVAGGDYPSRAEAVRAAVRAWQRKRYDDEIAESYRRGYAKYPEDEDWGTSAAIALAEVLAEQET